MTFCSGFNICRFNKRVETISGMSSTPVTLFCLDFDQTIVKGHYHNALYKTKKPCNHPDNKITIGNLLNDPNTGLKNGEETKQFIRLALSNGHKVAVTTYSKYPEVIVPTFQKMGLLEEEIDQIIQVAYLPPDQRVGKGGHIETAMRQCNVTDRANVWLIDDSSNNCSMARSAGYNVVEVSDDIDASADYFQPLMAAAQLKSAVTM